MKFTARAVEVYEDISDPSAYYGWSKNALKDHFGVGERTARSLHRMIRSHQEAKHPTVSPDRVMGEEEPRGGDYYELPSGEYLFTWRERGKSRSVVLTEEELKSILIQYTADGKNESMQRTATSHGLVRRDFARIKTIYGATKDHEPFTLREMKERGVDDLAEEQLALKRQKLMRQVEVEDERKRNEYARKYLQLMGGSVDPYAEVIKRVAGRQAPIGGDPLPAPPEDANRFIIFYQASDLHYGAYVDPRHAGDGLGYNRALAAHRFMDGLKEAVFHAERSYGRAEFMLLGVGGDIHHVDNTQGATTSMKHVQDLDGIPETIPMEVTKMYMDGIDWLLGRGYQVRLECVPGNHDALLSRGLFAALWAAYRGSPKVSYGNATSSHAYVLYGSTGLVIHHGDGEKTAEDLGASLEHWLRRIHNRVQFKYAITGNLHHLHLHEENGCILIQQPAPVSPDRWHRRKGFERSREATLAAYFGFEAGLLGLRYIGF